MAVASVLGTEGGAVLPEEELCGATETEAVCCDDTGVLEGELTGIFRLTFFLSATICGVLDWVNAVLFALLALALAASAARLAACARSSASRSLPGSRSKSKSG